MKPHFTSSPLQRGLAPVELSAPGVFFCRRDWFKIIRVWLRHKEITLEVIAFHCGVVAETVANWADYGEPKDTAARKILWMLKQHCPDEYKKLIEEENHAMDT